MSAPAANLRTYLQAFFKNWFIGMCGVLSVPFAAIGALWVHGPSAKLIWIGSAVTVFFVASFQVWREERKNGSKALEGLCVVKNAELKILRETKDAEIEELSKEVARLSRKPYQEDLRIQCEKALLKLSTEGKELLRYLVAHAPVSVHTRFINSVADQTQFQQMDAACNAGIVRRTETRNGLGHILDTRYEIVSQFATVLQDLLYTK
jgi:hypothetical protein